MRLYYVVVYAWLECLVVDTEYSNISNSKNKILK